jgi:hypothetical protein
MISASRLRSFGLAVLLALVVLVACRQIALHGGYAPHAAYRAQVDAMLDGRLALTRAPDGLIHDLAWTPSGVQQVWGLGAPLWQLPFELVGRIFGVSPFPDRIALLAWLVAMWFAVIRAFRPRDVGEARPDDQRRFAGRTRALDTRAMQFGAVLITALLPGFVALLRGRIGVYEEAAIYAYGAALMLMAGVIAVLRKPTTARYVILVGFAGLTGLIRPTVWFYSLAAVLIATAILVRNHGRAPGRAIALGLALFVAGGAALYATNAARFGSGTEFGHRLNVHSLPGNIVATRFGYPFERVGTVAATQELIGSLFDGPERRSKRGFYQTALHRWQSPVPRWREYYFTTFSWPYAVAIAAGLAIAALAWRRRGDPFARTLGAWAVLGGAPLAVFYLHAPSLTSRYQLDLAPAIAALLVIAWREAVARWPRASLAVLVALWGTAVATSKVTRPRGASDPVGRDAAARSTYAISRAIEAERRLPPGYDLADPLLPIWTDVAEDFARCIDARGEPIACDAPPLPGDVVIRGHRAGREWFVERAAIPDEPLAPECVPIGGARQLGNGDDRGEGDDGRGDGDDGDDGGGSGPRCIAAPTVRDDPTAVDDGGFVGPPALYLNGFGWDLATGQVPPATLFYVEDPQYIALDVAGPPGTDWDRAVRVALGLDRLRLVAAADTAGGARLRFAVPHRTGLHFAFVAFGPDDQLDRPRSAFRLRSIRWRDP